jgi:poly-beta-1,6-N-acetyl-D-glucosamine synthase
MWNPLLAFLLVFISIFFPCMLAYAWLIGFYSRRWKEVAISKTAECADYPFISVVIPFRNEQIHLPELIDCFKTLEYPTDRFEVIMVDDDSTDESVSIVQQAVSELPFLRLQKLKGLGETPGIAYKKKAIEKGISVSRGEWIVTTDADCTFDKAWLKSIAAFICSTNAKCIAAPVKIQPSGSILSVFQALDFLTLQGITAAAVHSRTHIMCNGANFAYTKAVFQEVNGFEEIDNIPSGDDMLLMQKIFEKYPADVHYLKAEEAVVTTAAAQSWKAFFQQRIRWASKSDQYKDKKILWILGLVWFFNFSYLLLAVLVLVYPKWAFLLLLFIIAKWLIEYGFVASVAGFFRSSSLMLFFLPLQPLHIVYTVVAGFLGRFGSYEWKGRQVKRLEHE